MLFFVRFAFGSYLFYSTANQKIKRLQPDIDTQHQEQHQKQHQQPQQHQNQQQRVIDTKDTGHGIVGQGGYVLNTADRSCGAFGLPFTILIIYKEKLWSL